MLAAARTAADQVGFLVIEAAEAFPLYRYTDVGGLVYYLKCISWEILDFSVNRYRHQLLALHRRMEARRASMRACISSRWS
jgi:hypothetical protein|tara:strand:+ start:261 stop:503 length:243 start_codon:yes stop_codon:yes gene_type:complete